MSDSVLPQQNLRSTVAEVADRLFAAIESGDADTVEKMWDDDVLVWKSAEPEDQVKTRALRVICWFMHILHATSRKGGSIALRVCIVIKLGANGLITKIDEYFDPAELEPLL